MSPDRLICEFDKALRTLCAPASSVRAVPGDDLPEAVLSASEKKHVAGLMRVNHCGEICAQALYQGQALTSRDPVVRISLEQAGHEETEHLAWTERRIHEVGGRTSFLNPLWYASALSLGVVAGCCGDAWSLGFLAETERQVEAHLDGHLSWLPEQDRKTREIVEQMKLDEMSHANLAEQLGGCELPFLVKALMKVAARAMTRTAYFV